MNQEVLPYWYESCVTMATRIAVFEPDSSLLKLFHALLTAQGYEPMLFQEAFSSRSRTTPPPDLMIVSNIRGYMAEELDTLYTLRTSSAFHGVPMLICTTGYLDEDATTLLCPASSLMMPFTPAALNAAIRGLLQYSAV